MQFFIFAIVMFSLAASLLASPTAFPEPETPTVEERSPKKKTGKKTSSKSSTSKSADDQSSGSGETYSGQATYFYQYGNPGACGWYSSDDDSVIAVNSDQYNQADCGKSITITDTENGQTHTGYIADECPSCEYGSLDLGYAFFGEFTDHDEGEFPITWELTDGGSL